MKSWKTTVSGILSIIAAGITLVAIPVLDSNPLTVANYEAFAAAVIAGVGLIAARDNNVTSEMVGAGKI